MHRRGIQSVRGVSGTIDRVFGFGDAPARAAAPASGRSDGDPATRVERVAPGGFPWRRSCLALAQLPARSSRVLAWVLLVLALSVFYGE